MIARLPIPAAALRQHVLVLGKTRAGKSTTLRGLAEHLLRDQSPVCIIDPKGDWWGLKSSADGKRPGFPVIIFGGQHADLPLNERVGSEVGELVATGNRPCIIDLGGWMPGQRTRFFVDFAAALFRHTRGPRHLIIDEVHNFAPQGKVLDPDAGKMLHWANRLASEGAGKGITLLSASQRPQKVHKDYVTSHETLIAMRVIHPLDRGAVVDWMAGYDPAKAREIATTLAGMARGEGWVWSPEIGFGPSRIQFPMFETYDSFKAPDHHGSADKLKGWAEVDLDEVRGKLAAVEAEHKANDVPTLKTRIAELEREAAKKPAAAPSVDLNKLQTEAWQDGYTSGYGEAVETITSPLFGVGRNLTAIAEKVETAITAAGEKWKGLTNQTSIVQPPSKAIKGMSEAVAHARSGAPPTRVATVKAAPAPAGEGGGASPTVRKILDVIHRSYPVALTFEAASLRAAVSRRSSAYRIYRKQVEESPEVERRSDGRFVSAPGYAADVGPGVDPVAEFATKLPPSYAAMLLAIKGADGPLDRQAIAAAANVSVTSSGLSAGLRELASLSLIQRHGDVYTLHEDLT